MRTKQTLSVKWTDVVIEHVPIVSLNWLETAARRHRSGGYLRRSRATRSAAGNTRKMTQVFA